MILDEFVSRIEAETKFIGEQEFHQFLAARFILALQDISTAIREHTAALAGNQLETVAATEADDEPEDNLL